MRWYLRITARALCTGRAIRHLTRRTAPHLCLPPHAQVAELVDALASGASGLTAVKVRVLSWAPYSHSDQSLRAARLRHDHPPAPRRLARPHRATGARWRSTPRRWGSIRIATGSAWCSSRPATASADVVQIPPGHADAPNLKTLLPTRRSLKIFHFARFDIAVLYNAFGVMPQPVYCTKIASRLARTYTDRHGLKDLVRELLGVDLSKQQQSTDWGADDADRGAGRLCRLRRAASARAAREARRHAGARRPHRAGRGLLRVPADARQARSWRLGGRGHFRPFVSVR